MFSMFPSKCTFYFFLGFGMVQIIHNCGGLKYTETQNEDQRETDSDISQNEGIQEQNSLEETIEGRRNLLLSSNFHSTSTTKQIETADEKETDSDISQNEGILEPNSSEKETREVTRNLLVSSNLHLANTTKQIETEDEKETDSDISPNEGILEPNSSENETREVRRNLLFSSNLHLPTTLKQTETEDEKEEKLKSKIAMLVEQTIQDTNKRIQLVSHIREQLRSQGPYKAGFILSMIKKSKTVVDELFNVAAKHKNEWKALEQLKVFELIVHTNVDTTNLLRQLVEVHVQNMNSTSKTGVKRQMVLIK